MTKFKVGDKVKLKQKYTKNSIFANEEFTITGVAGDRGRFTLKSEMNNSFWHYFIDDIEEYMESIEYKLIEDNKMPELMSGMRVKCRNGTVYVVVKDLGKMFRDGGFSFIEYYNELGVYKDWKNMAHWDIVQVYSGNKSSDFFNFDELGELIWEHKDSVKEAKQKRIRELGEILAATQKELDSLSEY